MPTRIGKGNVKIIPFETFVVFEQMLSRVIDLLKPNRAQRGVLGHFVEGFSFFEKEPPWNLQEDEIDAEYNCHAEPGSENVVPLFSDQENSADNNR